MHVSKTMIPFQFLVPQGFGENGIRNGLAAFSLGSSGFKREESSSFFCKQATDLVDSCGQYD
jgi:hypothetical protein